MSSLNIVFFGTPGFAIPSLKALIDRGYGIKAVVTAPDRPSGRGRKLREPEVKIFAKSKDLPVLQPDKMSDPGFIKELKSLNADLFIVVAFRKLPEGIWKMPKKGTFNLHASLLPQYRGAAPINWVLINGEKETGLTTFFINDRIDTGDLLLQKSIPVSDTDNAGSLHDSLSAEGAGLVLKTVQGIEKGTLKATSQKAQDSGLKKAPKIHKEDCRICWNAGKEKVYNHIRGLSPYPTAWTLLEQKTVKIYKAEKEEGKPKESHGTLITDGNSFLKVAVNDGYIKLIELQLQGKKRMHVDDFLKGARLKGGEKLT